MATATARTPGFDVARAVAVLGMVLVNFRGKVHATESLWSPVVWALNRIEGKAAALFVVLAGVGISLRTRRARAEGGDRMRAERRAQLERAGVLLALGLVDLHMWNWDILHFYGVYLVLAVPLLGLRDRWLWGCAALVLAGSSVLQHTLEWTYRPEFWTALGATRRLMFNGLHPVFPWMAFLVVGMALGRLDLRDAKMRRRVLVWGLVAWAGAEVIDALARQEQAANAMGLAKTAWWWRTWPRPPRPLFVISGLGMSAVMICACIQLTQGRGDRRWVITLMATGQLAFTLYVVHAIAILIPLQHGLLSDQPVEVTVLYGLAFYAVAMAGAVWWRRRWPYGPIEGLVRQVTQRVDPAPWGGSTLR